MLPSRSNEYGPTGARVIKIGLTGDQWMDPRALQLFCVITNTTSLPQPTFPDSPIHAFTHRLGPVGPDVF